MSYNPNDKQGIQTGQTGVRYQRPLMNNQGSQSFQSLDDLSNDFIEDVLPDSPILRWDSFKGEEARVLYQIETLQGKLSKISKDSPLLKLIDIAFYPDEVKFYSGFFENYSNGQDMTLQLMDYRNDLESAVLLHGMPPRKH